MNPTDPSEKDFRTRNANLTMEEMREIAHDLDLSDTDLRHLQSKEWAERMRPLYQWEAKLKVWKALCAPINSATRSTPRKTI